MESLIPHWLEDVMKDFFFFDALTFYFNGIAINIENVSNSPRMNQLP